MFFTIVLRWPSLLRHHFATLCIDVGGGVKLSSSGHRVSFHQLILRRRRHNKQARYKRKNRKLLDSTVKSAPSVMCTYAVDSFCGLLLFLLKVTCIFCRQLLDSQPFVFVHVLLDSAAVFASSLQCMAASITLFISFRILQYITSLLRERAAFIKSREAVMFYLLRTLQVMPSTIISNCVFDALGISSHTISASMALLSMYITENFARKAQFLSAALNIGYDDAYWQLYLSLRAIGREKYMNLCAIDVFACANGFKIFVSLPAVDGTPAQIVVLNPSGSTCVHMIVTGKRSCAHAISVSPAEFALQTASSVTSTECRSWFEWNIGHKSTDADKPASDSQRVLRSRVQKSSEFIRSCVVLCCTYYNTPYSMCSISALEKFGEVPDFDDADEQEDLEAEMIDLECDSDDDGDGDGDGELFQRFTKSVDVIAHELTHGITQYEASLQYSGESGALNESFSDVFGSLVKQRVKNHTAQEADWIIGEGLLAPTVKGIGIRSLKAPGTAYDDKLLGQDPQPGHVKDKYTGTDDNGGVHINSGIPNQAFYLAAVEIGGYAWEKAGKIWYIALRDRLRATDDFQRAAQVTMQVAGELYGIASPEQKAIENAWQKVGVLS